MEKWDLYNEDRCPLGNTILSGGTKAKGEYHFVVNVWTLNNRGEILLTLRHPDKYYYPNAWENTGGSVWSGESSQQGAVRELKEETGIEVNEKDLIYLGTYKDISAFIDTYVVYKNIEIQNLTLQEGETVNAKWVSITELDEMIKDRLLASPVVEYLTPLRELLEKYIYMPS